MTVHLWQDFEQVQKPLEVVKSQSKELKSSFDSMDQGKLLKASRSRCGPSWNMPASISSIVTTWSRIATQRADRESSTRWSRKVLLANRTAWCQIGRSGDCGKLMMHKLTTNAAWKRKYLWTSMRTAINRSQMITYVAYQPSSLVRPCTAY